MPIEENPVISIRPERVASWGTLEAPRNDEPTVLDAVRGRRSVRRYLPREVDGTRGRGTRGRTLGPFASRPAAVALRRHRRGRPGAARQGDGRGVAGNLVMDGQAPEVVERRLEGSRRRLLDAPVLVLLCLYLEDLDAYPDAGRQQSETTMAVQSLGAAAQNMLLAAYDRGLDAGWMCALLPGGGSRGSQPRPEARPARCSRSVTRTGTRPAPRTAAAGRSLGLQGLRLVGRAPPGALQTHLQSGIIAGADDLEGVGLGWRNGSFVGVLLVAFGAALWGTDAVLRVPLLEVMSPAAIVLSEHLVLLLYSVPAVVLGWGVLAGLRASQWVALLIIAWGGSALATLLFDRLRPGQPDGRDPAPEDPASVRHSPRPAA